jgi:hypothetical protein
MKWRVVKDQYYLIAILVFASIVGIWSMRNIYRFWDGSFQDIIIAWQTDQHLSRCIVIALERPGRLILVASVKILWLVIMLSPWIFLTGSQLLRIRKHLQDERVSGIAISFLIPLVISGIICAIFSIGEGFEHNPVLNWDNNRYILVSVIPLLWYAFEVDGLEKDDVGKIGDGAGRDHTLGRPANPRRHRSRASTHRVSGRRMRASRSSERPRASWRDGQRPPLS